MKFLRSSLTAFGIMFFVSTTFGQQSQSWKFPLSIPTTQSGFPSPVVASTGPLAVGTYSVMAKTSLQNLNSSREPFGKCFLILLDVNGNVTPGTQLDETDVTLDETSNGADTASMVLSTVYVVPTGGPNNVGVHCTASQKSQFTNTAITVTSLQGPQGLQGVAGVPGPPGAAGPQGPAGATGATGSAGPAGAQGSPGSQGPQGIDGLAGPQGQQGLQGPPGTGTPSVPNFLSDPANGVTVSGPFVNSNVPQALEFDIAVAAGSHDVCSAVGTLVYTRTNAAGTITSVNEVIDLLQNQPKVAAGSTMQALAEYFGPTDKFQNVSFTPIRIIPCGASLAGGTTTNVTSGWDISRNNPF
jgi:hypothetical protein